MTCVVSSRPKWGTGPIFNFIMQKVYFSRLMQILCWLNNVSDLYFSRFPCLLLVSRVWDISSGIGPCFTLARTMQIVRQCRREIINTAQPLLHTSSKQIHFYQKPNPAHETVPLISGRICWERLGTCPTLPLISAHSSMARTSRTRTV